MRRAEIRIILYILSSASADVRQLLEGPRLGSAIAAAESELKRPARSVRQTDRYFFWVLVQGHHRDSNSEYPRRLIFRFSGRVQAGRWIRYAKWILPIIWNLPCLSADRGRSNNSRPGFQHPRLRCQGCFHLRRRRLSRKFQAQRQLHHLSKERWLSHLHLSSGLCALWARYQNNTGYHLPEPDLPHSKAEWG